MDDLFVDWDVDLGSLLYDTGRRAVEVSLPHILNVQIIPFFPGARPVVLFGAFNSLQAPNFGNTGDIKVTYRSSAFGLFTYEQLLASNIGIPIHVGTTRIETSSLRQLSQPLSILSSVGLGKFDGEPRFPMGFPENFQPTIAYLTEPYTIDGFTRINYLQNASSDPNVKMYFYQTANISLERALSGNKVVANYCQPQTNKSNHITITTQKQQEHVSAI
jgi:hypothetical protein